MAVVEALLLPSLDTEDAEIQTIATKKIFKRMTMSYLVQITKLLPALKVEQLQLLIIELVSIACILQDYIRLTCLSCSSTLFLPPRFLPAAGMIPYANQAQAPSQSTAAIYAHHNVVATFDYLPWLNPERENVVAAPVRSKSSTSTPPPAASVQPTKSGASLEEPSHLDDIMVE